MRKQLILLCMALCLLCLAACGSRETDEEIEGRIAGKYYVYEKESFGGNGDQFVIHIKSDGTYSYHEGILSSYIGKGSWRVENGILMLLTGKAFWRLPGRSFNPLIFCSESTMQPALFICIAL